MKSVMKVLVTGSAGHLGEALVRTYRTRATGYQPRLLARTRLGLSPIGSGPMHDRRSPYGSLQASCLHAAAKLRCTNITGTSIFWKRLRRLVRAFVFTSTSQHLRWRAHTADAPAGVGDGDVISIPKTSMA